MLLLIRMTLQPVGLPRFAENDGLADLVLTPAKLRRSGGPPRTRYPHREPWVRSLSPASCRSCCMRFRSSMELRCDTASVVAGLLARRGLAAVFRERGEIVDGDV